MRPSEKGFSLIEAVLAIGILAVVVSQVVSIQSSTISINQTAMNNMKATWALRSATSQLEYVLDVYGVKDGLRKEIVLPKSEGSDMTVKITVADPPIEASRLIMSALRLGNAMQKKEGEDQGSGDPGGDSMKEQMAMLDNVIPKDLYRSVKVEAEWQEGLAKRTLDTGVFLINERGIDFDFSSMTDMLGGGAGGDGGESGGSAPGGTPKKTAPGAGGPPNPQPGAQPPTL